MENLYIVQKRKWERELVVVVLLAILKNNDLDFAYPTELRIHRDSDGNESPDLLTQEE